MAVTAIALTAGTIRSKIRRKNPVTQFLSLGTSDLRDPDDMSIKPGNTKLGLNVHHWSLPADRESVCVGASSLCHKFCYARKGHYNRSSVKKFLANNLVESMRSDFVTWIGWQLRTMFVIVLRVHASGDFYSAEYVDKWVDIAKRNPKVLFFAYTRSWREAELRPSLERLASLSNFRLWLSCDMETGEPVRMPFTRVAYMAVSDADQPHYEVDLVFRDRRRVVRKWIGGALVCPAENGVTKTTCSQCRICFREEQVPKRIANELAICT